MTTQTPRQLGVCSWSMLPQSADDMARIMAELGLAKLQLGLVPHRDDAGIVDGVPEALEKVGARVVSGMFGTVGEDYATMETIKKTGGIVPDEHWEENQAVARAAAARARRRPREAARTNLILCWCGCGEPTHELVRARASANLKYGRLIGACQGGN